MHWCLTLCKICCVLLMYTHVDKRIHNSHLGKIKTFPLTIKLLNTDHQIICVSVTMYHQKYKSPHKYSITIMVNCHCLKTLYFWRTQIDEEMKDDLCNSQILFSGCLHLRDMISDLDEPQDILHTISISSFIFFFRIKISILFLFKVF